MSRSGTDETQQLSFVELAESALERGDRSAALAALEDARRSEPSNEELPLLAAKLWLDEGRLDRALELTLDAIATRPHHPAAMNVLGVVLLDAAQPKLARRVLERAVRMAPALRGVRNNLKDATRRVKEARRGRGPSNQAADPAARMPLALGRCDALIARRDPTLAACIFLAKGEESALKRCLDSLAEVADEIHVVDPRSGRDPLPIAEGVNVHVAEGSCDAATIGNRALARIRSDWILVLDASESLDPDGTDALRRALSDRRALAGMVEIHQGDRRVRFQAPRLVRNAAGLGFNKRFGRLLLPSLTALERKWGLTIRSGGGILLREGSSLPAADLDTKAAISSILATLTEEDPLYLHARLALAERVLADGHPAEALEHVREARSSVEGDRLRSRPLEAEPLVIVEGRCLMRLRRFDELASLVAEHHRRYPESASTLFLEGVAAKGLGHSVRAVELLRRCVDADGAVGYAPPAEEVCSSVAANLLGAACMDLGDLESATAAFRLSRAIDPDGLEAGLGQLGILHARGEFETLLRELDRLAESHGDDPNAWLAGAIVVVRDPELAGPALAWLEEAHKRFPDHCEIRRRLGEVQLRTGGAARAIETWSALGEGDDALRAGRIAAALANDSELPWCLDATTKPVSDEVQAWFERWMSFGAYTTLDQALMNIARGDRALPGLGDRAADWLERIGQDEAARGVRSRV